MSVEAAELCEIACVPAVRNAHFSAVSVEVEDSCVPPPSNAQPRRLADPLGAKTLVAVVVALNWHAMYVAEPD
jgi:hypothetical protein